MGISYNPRTVTDGLVLALDAGNTKSYSAAAGEEATGQAEYTSSGSYSWTCPSNVTSVSVVCVGGGAGGPGSTWDNDESGGGGGGLGYKNNISVTAGQSYTVVVGSGGVGPQNGGDSYFINTTTVKGGGGSYGYQGAAAPGGTYVGDGGGNGGDGGVSGSPGYGGGGGGAGGYSGNGGDGANGIESGQPVVNGTGGNGSGGGGGGGSSHHGGSGGGGVGIYGEGPSGSGDLSVTTDTTYGGRGGSGGSPGGNGDANVSPYTGGDGGAYGGGGGGSADGSRPNSTGGGGAVRIIWGSGRSFPTTLTSNQPTTSGSSGGGASNVWKDGSVNGNNGTISGATHTSGVGGYFDFDGSNDYVSHSNDSFVSNGGATLECWFSADTGSALRSLINHSGFTYFNLVRDSNNKIRLEYKSTSANNTQLFSSSTIFVGISSWYHVVGVVDNTGARIYINGELDASYSTPQNLGTVSSTLYIGGYSSSSTYRFDGKIAVAKRYNKPLTASEVTQNYNALRGRFGI